MLWLRFCLATLWGIICLKCLSIATKKTKFTISFQVIRKSMAQAIDEISNLLENVKLAKDNFLGKDLSVERNFCDAVSEQVSTFLGQKIMAICCETFVLNETTCKILMTVIDEMVLQLGWCSQYKIDRIVHYPRPLINEIAKTSIVEFYWLNKSKNRHNKQENLTKFLFVTAQLVNF